MFFSCFVFSVFPQLSINKMDPMSQVFCLRWNNHRNNLLNVLDQLLQTEAFCDVTLACENASIKCHKMILSACSTYFQSLFMENTCEHPIVFLKDIKIQEIKVILDYMYKGEVNVAQEELPGQLALPHSTAVNHSGYTFVDMTSNFLFDYSINQKYKGHSKTLKFGIMQCLP